MNRKNITIFLAGMLLGTTLLLAVQALRPQPQPLQDVYQNFNHFRMYEDGSIIGETINGVPVSGCIKGALCND